jgi:HAD superfamily hydrolase (TIGR01549 family)
VTGAQLKVERFRRFLDSLGAAIPADAFSREYLLRLAQGTFLIEGAEDLLAALRARFTLAIVTNGLAEVQRPRLDRSAIGPSFETVVVSEEVGAAKPDVRIFQHALRALGHDDPSTVLMVGDSLESDIRGGINAGMRTCWFNPSGVANDTAIQPTCEVASLRELRDRLADVNRPSASEA